MKFHFSEKWSVLPAGCEEPSDAEERGWYVFYISESFKDLAAMLRLRTMKERKQYYKKLDSDWE